MAAIVYEEATERPVPHPNREELRCELERIGKAARALLRGATSVVAPIVTFMRERFLPRANAEEAAIYAKLARAFSRDATAMLLFHSMIERQAAELAAADVRNALLSLILLEFGDFPMMRKLMLGLKTRAELHARTQAPAERRPSMSARHGPTATSVERKAVVGSNREAPPRESRNRAWVGPLPFSSTRSSGPNS